MTKEQAISIIREAAERLPKQTRAIFEQMMDGESMTQIEKRMNLPGGLYHELQVRMTYNSNHMEGSRLSED